MHKNVFFQMFCHLCYEVLHQEEHTVKVNKNGEPSTKQVKHIFSGEAFIAIKECPNCGDNLFGHDIGILSGRRVTDDPDDLPF